MDKIIQNMPNNIVAIICTVKAIDKNNDNYAIIPQEVSFGKIDESNCFIPEGSEDRLIEVSRFEEMPEDEENKFYLYPIEIEELKRKYSDKSTSIELAIAYYTEIRNNINLLYRTKNSEEPTIESVVKRSTEDLKKLNEKMEQEYHERKMNIKSSEKKDSYTDSDLSHIKRRELSTYLKERILKNDSLMDDISTVIVANFRAKNPKLMKNILCVGPTGSGKTETFNLIAKFADIPITTIDCNGLTAEGFVGKGMDDIFKQIYATCGGDMSKAARSILFLDEVDKIASRGDPIKDLDVQQGLLKILEGFNYSFENKRGSGQLQIDTSFMTKVGSGAFMDLFDKRKVKRPLGFNSKEEKIEEKVLVDKDIINYGFLPEFVGRFPLIYTYKPLDEDGLKQFLTVSKISPLLQIKERLQEEYGCTIEYDEDFLYEVIQAALLTEAGGRSLSKIIDNSFIKLEGALIDEQDEGHELPKTLKLKKEMVNDPNNFNL